MQNTNTRVSQLRGYLRWVLALVVIAVIATVSFPLTARAHDFDGSGDCEGWFLELDGTFGAHTIYIDGQPNNPATEYFIPDSSGIEQRTFVVFWDKDRNDVTRSHTLERDTDGCTPSQPTTTIAEGTTTTIASTTTTTGGAIIVFPPTTTTPTTMPGTDPFPQPEIPDIPRDWQAPTTQAPPEAVTLPFTGSNSAILAGVAGLVIILGSLLVRGRETETE